MHERMRSALWVTYLQAKTLFVIFTLYDCLVSNRSITNALGRAKVLALFRWNLLPGKLRLLPWWWRNFTSKQSGVFLGRRAWWRALPSSVWTGRDGHERGKHVSLLSRFEPDTRDELSVFRRIIHASIPSVLLAKTNYGAKFVWGLICSSTTLRVPQYFFLTSSQASTRLLNTETSVL